MNTQLKLALYRFVALLIAVGGGDALIQFLNGGYDLRHLGVVIAADAVLAGEEYLKSGQLLSDLGLSATQVGTSSPTAPPQNPVATQQTAPPAQ